MPRTIYADETTCACMGAPTITEYNAMGDMERCQFCETAVAWDKVDDPFWGFGEKPCEHAREDDEAASEHATDATT